MMLERGGMGGSDPRQTRRHREEPARVVRRCRAVGPRAGHGDGLCECGARLSEGGPRGRHHRRSGRVAVRRARRTGPRRRPGPRSQPGAGVRGVPSPSDDAERPVAALSADLPALRPGELAAPAAATGRRCSSPMPRATGTMLAADAEPLRPPLRAGIRVRPRLPAHRS